MCMYEISGAGLAMCIAMASEGKAVCMLERVIRGHYIYKGAWTQSY